MFGGRTGKLIICFAGIFISYTCFATLQEQITKGQYIDNGLTDKFVYSLSLTSVQCTFYCFFANVLLVTVMKEGKDTTAQSHYVKCASTYLLAMLFSNESLQYVSYPTQVIGKAVKPIPVMIFGIIFAGKRYPKKKYGVLALIVIGVFVSRFLFIYEDNIPLKENDDEFYGQVMLIFSLLLDGYNGLVEEKMRRKYQTQSVHMMINVNLYSSIASAFIVIAKGEIFNFYKFLVRHPIAMLHIGLLCLCGAVGQFFIFFTVSQFGPLVCSIVTSTRKCFSIVFSVLIFGNTLSARQWAAAVIVCIGLFANGFSGHSRTVEEYVARVSMVRPIRYGRLLRTEN